MSESTRATFTIRDPLAGDLSISGESLEEAIAEAYDKIPPNERPAYVWHQGVRVAVPDGLCEPC